MALFDEAFNNQNFVEAERYGRRSLEIVDQLQLGDGKRATSLSSTAQALRHQKKFAESEPLFRQALALREKVLPPNHPRTASTLEGLAVSLVGLQRLDEAGPYYLRALAIWDRAGDDEEPCPHGKVLDGLGRIYFRQGKLDQAEPLYQRAISIWIAAKEKCSVIVPAMNDLAALYWARGDTSKAEAMYLRTIPMLQRELGDDQPELVARQQANLARVYVAQKKFSESIPLLESAVSVFEKRQPVERETLKWVLSLESSALRELHRDSDMQRVEAQLDAIEGIKAESIDPLIRWQGLMGLRRHATTREQQVALLQQALQEAERLPPGEPLSRTLVQLAGALEGTDNALAERYFKRALANNQTVFGPDSAQVAEGLECLASFYEAFQKSVGAEALRLRALAIRAKQGSDMQLVMSREQLAALYAHQNRFAEAESQYLQAFEVKEKLPGMTEDTDVVLVQGLGDLYRNWGKYQDAARYYTRLLQIEEKQMGSNSPRLLARLQMLADLMRKLGRPADAQQYDERRKNIVDEQIARGNSSPTK